MILIEDNSVFWTDYNSASEINCGGPHKKEVTWETEGQTRSLESPYCSPPKTLLAPNDIKIMLNSKEINTTISTFKANFILSRILHADRSSECGDFCLIICFKKKGKK